jgi:hypothetical protein
VNGYSLRCDRQSDVSVVSAVLESRSGRRAVSDDNSFAYRRLRSVDRIASTDIRQQTAPACAVTATAMFPVS